jgi:hypothetical protein
MNEKTNGQINQKQGILLIPRTTRNVAESKLLLLLFSGDRNYLTTLFLTF